MSNAPDIVRVFIALDISAPSRQILVDTMGRLQEAIPRGVKWVDPAGIHLTLKFLGNINVNLVDEVINAMRESAQGHVPFQLQLDGLGVFPNRRDPRVLWSGVRGDIDALAALQQQVDAAVSKLGFALEKRPFNPHLTLGRVRAGAPPIDRQRVSDAMTTTTVPESAPWQAQELRLIRSNLTPTGAIYTLMGATSLSGQ